MLKKQSWREQVIDITWVTFFVAGLLQRDATEEGKCLAAEVTAQAR